MNENLKDLKKNVEIIEMTPDMARDFLVNQRENRRIKKTNLNKLVNDLQNGNYQYNGDSIRFDRHGRMGDGQHRCKACMITGVTITVLVVRNLPDEAFPTIDKGVGRTIGDELKFTGAPNPSNLAATIKSYVAIMNGAVVSDGHGNFYCDSKNLNSALTAVQVKGMYEKDKESWDDIVKYARSVYRQSKYVPAPLAGGVMYYLEKDKHHPEDVVYKFFEQLGGKRDSEYECINLLRDFMKDRYYRRSTIKTQGSLMLGMLTKAWNAYITGKSIKRLSYNREKEGIIPFI